VRRSKFWEFCTFRCYLAVSKFAIGHEFG
jgi:hypothetical protein